MNIRQAREIFAKFGAHLRSDDVVELRHAWIMLAKQYHVRAARDDTHERAMAEINAAYDLLKANPEKAKSGGVTTDDPRIRGVCVWAWAGHSGTGLPPSDRIETADERDINYVKRRIWQLSGHSKEQWSIWSFDGRRFMPPLAVYGTRSIFDQMAGLALQCTRVGFRRPRAVFVQKLGLDWPNLLLIHSDGGFNIRSEHHRRCVSRPRWSVLQVGC